MRAFFLAALVLPLLGAAPSPNDPIAYRLAPELTSGELKSLQVEVRFRTDANGVAGFGWSRGWQGEDKLWQWSRDIKVSGASSFRQDAPGHWQISGKPGTVVTISYRVVSAYDHDPTVGDHEQPKPIIRPRWFYVPGEALFGRPDGSEKAPARFAWKGAAGFNFASDLEHLAGTGRQQGTVGDVIESILIGGRDLRLYSNEATSGVRVAVLGKFSFTPSEFESLARQVVSVERSFWNAEQDAPFLVTLGPLAGSPAQMGFEGTGRNDAFALWVDERSPIQRLKWLLAHEYFHSWNPSRLGHFKDDEETDPSLFWFSEGLTDYYARALLVRSGLITPQEFVDQWNEALRAYAASPAKTMKGADVAATFFSDEAAQKVSYQRGAMLAATWNAKLSKTGKGLDDLLHQQLAASQASAADPISLFSRLAAMSGLDIGDDVRRHIDGGETIWLPPNVFGPCATVATEERPVFSRGFDAEASARANNVISGVDPTSNAHAAGLRDGMKILSRVAGEPDNSMLEYALLVEDHGKRRTIRYLPQGRERVSVQQVSLRSPSAASCAASLGGVRP